MLIQTSSTDENNAAIENNALGKHYRKGTVIFREGESAECMFTILSGEVDLMKKTPDGVILVTTLREGDMLGIRSIFIDKRRVTTAVARTDVGLLTVKKTLLLESIARDPSLALRVIENLTDRTSRLNDKLSHLETELPPYADPK